MSDWPKDFEGNVCKHCRESLFSQDDVTDGQIFPGVCEKCGLDLEDFSAVDIPAISTRENHREMNRFFPRELSDYFFTGPKQILL